MGHDKHKIYRVFGENYLSADANSGNNAMVFSVAKDAEVVQLVMTLKPTPADNNGTIDYYRFVEAVYHYMVKHDRADTEHSEKYLRKRGIY